MNTVTLETLETSTGVSILEHLDRGMEIPVITDAPQAQGDLMIIPIGGNVAGTVPVPKEGVVLVRGENGGNTHLLLGDGPLLWREGQGGLDVGTIVVPEGSIGVIAHPEHGFNRVGAGVYGVRRQREMADEIRLVQD